MTFLIECQFCNWQPDGKAYWRCSCGHLWNTFETKGLCPNCKIQWETTYCPGCGKVSPHINWYIDSKSQQAEDPPEILELKIRKKRLENKLVLMGIKNYRISHLPYLDYSNVEFQSPYEVGCRLIILFAISYSVHHLNERKKIIDWLKRETIWEKVSIEEKKYFIQRNPTEELLMDLSWRIESALLLAWVLNLIDKIHEIDIEETEDEFEQFLNKIPEINGSTKEFINKLHYRDIGEVYEENLLNEIATTYFRDLLFNGNKDETKINRMVSFERHQTLNWVRKFSGVNNWDEIDTST